VNRFCLAIERFDRPNEILLGGTFMRQNNIIFDVSRKRIGMARAACSSDPNQILNVEEMFTYSEGNMYVKDLDKEVEVLGSHFS
jgi:hypothetical protein